MTSTFAGFRQLFVGVPARAAPDPAAGLCFEVCNQPIEQTGIASASATVSASFASDRRITILPLSEAYMPEAHAQQPIEQTADQKTYQRSVHPHVLQVLADTQLQPLDDGVGVPAGHHLGDEVGEPLLR
jgi:hypothetical protein